MLSYFSKNFKFLRNQQGKSQTELADDLSISRSKIASYEGRGVEPKLSLLIEIAKYFDISIVDFIGTDIELSINKSGAGSIRKFSDSSTNSGKSSVEEEIYLNVHDGDSLQKFLTESASIVKMLEGFKVFYKIKTEGSEKNDLSPEVKKAHHDIQNVLFLIDYLLQHNKELITVLSNSEAA